MSVRSISGSKPRAPSAASRRSAKFMSLREDERSDIRERSRMSLRSCGLQNGSVLALNFRLIACYPSVVALIRPCSPACYFFATLHFPGASWTRACIFPVIYREPVLVKCTPKVRHVGNEDFGFGLVVVIDYHQIAHRRIFFIRSC